MAANLHLDESEIATALRQAGGVKRKAADILGTTPVTISHYMKKFPRLQTVVERAKAERREAADRNRKQKEGKSEGGMSGLLNPKQRRFVDQYLINLNPKEAAIKAGYGGTPQSAAQYATVLMKKPHVKAAIDEGIRERSIRTGIDQDMVVKALARVAFASLTDFLTWDSGGVILKPADQIDVDRLGAIGELSRNADRFKLTLRDLEPRCPH